MKPATYGVQPDLDWHNSELMTYNVPHTQRDHRVRGMG